MPLKIPAKAFIFSITLGAVVALAFGYGATPAQAAVVYEQPDDGSLLFATTGQLGGGSTFTLTESTEISSIEFYASTPETGGEHIINIVIDPTYNSSLGDDGIVIAMNDDSGGGSYHAVPSLVGSDDEPVFIEIPDMGSVNGLGGTYSGTMTLPAGTYYVYLAGNFIGQDIYTLGTGSSMYVRIADGDGFLIPGDGNTNSHVIRINSPAVESTVASTTFSVDFDFLMKPGDAQDPNGIEISAENLGGAGGIYYTRFSTVDLGYTSEDDGTVQNEELEITVPFAGTYKVGVRLIHSDAFFNAPPYSFSINPISSVGLPKYTYVHVVSEDYDLYGSSSPTITYVQYASTSCQIDWDLEFNAADCVGYLFTPSEDVWGSYSELDDQLLTRFPFSYMPELNEIRNAIYSNWDADPPAIEVEILNGELTLLSRDMVAAVPYAPLIKSLLAALIWLLLIYALYAMILKIHDKETKV